MATYFTLNTKWVSFIQVSSIFFGVYGECLQHPVAKLLLNFMRFVVVHCHAVERYKNLYSIHFSFNESPCSGFKRLIMT